MNRIKEILKAHGLKQTWLADKLGKSYNTVNAYIQNRQQPRLEVLFEISKILDVDVKDLIDEGNFFESRKITVIDLFAGCGGLSEGFLISGQYRELAHVEWELPMVNTLRHRLTSKWGHSKDEASKRVIHFDIQKTSELINGNWSDQTLAEYGATNHGLVCKNGLRGLVNSELDLIIGGPPCQAYSLAGRAQDPNSMKDDYRNFLFESFVEVVKEFRPRLFVFENVPGMLSAAPGGIPVTKRIHESFRRIGYKIPTPNEMKGAQFSSELFGVPQKRNRVILVGVREDMPYTYSDIYQTIKSRSKKSKTKTVKDALYDLPAIYPMNCPVKQNGKKISHKARKPATVSDHIPRFHNQRDINLFREWIRQEMNWKNTEDRLAFYNNQFDKKSNHIKYRNLEWDKPSPTIVAHLHKDGLMFIHPEEEQARSITIREAARLQSFPDDFEFIGNQGYKYKMIGNAVPPLMAAEIARSIAEVIIR